MPNEQSKPNLDIDAIMQSHAPDENQYANVKHIADELRNAYITKYHGEMIRGRFLQEDFWMAVAIHWIAHTG